MKEFTDADVRDGRISVDRSELIYSPTRWQLKGLQETASGYGKRLNTSLKIRFNGKNYRLYCTIFSNIGTVWFMTRGQKILVG